MESTVGTQAMQRGVEVMFRDDSNHKSFTADRPSPWPFVGGMLVCATVVSALVAAFAG